MTSDDPHPRGDDERGRVIRFAPRARPAPPPLRVVPPGAPPAAGLDKYSKAGGEDDFRQRMIVNVAGLTLVVVLILCGVWLADTMAQMRKNQDCVLMGRRNCAEINAPPQAR